MQTAIAIFGMVTERFCSPTVQARSVPFLGQLKKVAFGHVLRSSDVLTVKVHTFAPRYGFAYSIINNELAFNTDSMKKFQISSPNLGG